MPEIPNSKRVWDESWKEKVRSHGLNSAPSEALIRNVAYHLRHRHPDRETRNLHYLELGCGEGTNLLWLAGQGLAVSAVDFSPTALDVCRRRFELAGLEENLRDLVEGSIDATPFADLAFDGIVESCVLQHLDARERPRAFAEIRRLLKPGGVFCGYMHDELHSVYQARRCEELSDDPGTLVLRDGGSRFEFANTGLNHFFTRDEILGYFKGFSVVDPCAVSYFLPGFEARRRGYAEYRQGMWAVYAVK